MLDSRRWLALCAALTLIIALPAAADAKRPKPNRAGHKATKKVKAPRADWDRDGLNNRYVEIKRSEWEDYRVQVTPWELDRYLSIL